MVNTTTIMLALLSLAMLYAINTIIKHNDFVNKCNVSHGIVVKSSGSLICIKENSIINIK